MKFTRGLSWALLLLALPAALWAQQGNGDDDLVQTIAFTLPAQVTAGTIGTLNGIATSGLPVSYTSLTTAVCTVTGNQVSYLVPGNCQIRATQPGNGVYDDAPPVTASTTVVAAAGNQPQTVVFTLPAQVNPGNTSNLAPNASSGLPITYVSSTPGVCTVSATTVTYLTAGTCTITGTQPGNGTFAPAPPTSQTTTVVLLPQTINFVLPAQAASGTTGTLAGTATSNLPVSYTSSTPGICTVTGTTVSYLTAGTCTIVANQAGDQTYAAATAVSQTATVFVPGGQPQTITFTLPAQAFPQSSTVLSGTATSGLPVQYTSSTPAVCSIANNSVNFLAPGTCTVVATQPGDANFAAAPDVTRSTIVAAPIPTLGEWGMLGLAGLLLLFGMSQLKQRSEHGL